MIERAIRQVTGVMAESYIVVPMEKREDGMYLGRFEDPKLPRTHELFLEAKGADEETLRQRLPRLAKIGSWNQIGYILNAAMPGVLNFPVEYRPPAPAPVKPGPLSTAYLVDQAGAITGTISSALGTIAIYQPHRSPEGRPPVDRGSRQGK